MTSSARRAQIYAVNAIAAESEAAKFDAFAACKRTSEAETAKQAVAEKTAAGPKAKAATKPAKVEAAEPRREADGARAQ